MERVLDEEVSVVGLLPVVDLLVVLAQLPVINVVGQTISLEIVKLRL